MAFFFSLLRSKLDQIQARMGQKSMLWEAVYARALRASQDVKKTEVWWARDAPDTRAVRGRVRVFKAFVWGVDL
jgi:hypothetical protein